MEKSISHLKSDKTGLLLVVVIAFVYYVTGKLSFYYTIDNMIVTISVFFPEGFALASVLIFGIRVIAGIFLGQFFLALTQGFVIFPSFLIAISNASEALLALYIFKRVGFDIRLLTIKDIYTFIAVVVFILQPFSAFCGSVVLYLFDIIKSDEISSVFFSWWFGNLMGQLLLTPFLLYLYHNYKNINFYKLIFISGALGFICYSFIYLIPLENSSVLFSITIIPLVMLLSYRYGIVYALFSIVVITLITIYTANNHIGPFSVYDEKTNLINLNFYILAHILIVLVIGVLFIEKNEALKNLVNFNKKLEQRVVTEVEKNRQKDRLMFFQSRLAQIGEMVSLLVHQWKQPLNNLFLMNQVFYLNSKKKEITKREIEEFYNDSKTQIKEMIKTADEFKDFFKPNKKKKRFCINDILDHVVELVVPVLDHNKIVIQKEYLCKVYIYGYENEFAQAVLNIVNNSKDAFMKSSEKNKKITITLLENENTFVLRIKDNAGGIQEAIKKKIFEPYFTTKEEKEGTGLGLYMTKLIVEEYMNGSIEVKNEESGALFEIVFSNATPPQTSF